MPIIIMNPGEKGRIERIAGNDEIRQHLFEMGFIVGDTITVVANNAGNMILQVKNGRVAVDRKIANRVIVS